MNIKKMNEGMVQDESVIYSYQEFCEICVIDKSVIEEMIEFGIIEPPEKTSKSNYLSSRSLTRAKKALRLYHDLDINLAGISLVFDLLDEINELRSQLAFSSTDDQTNNKD